MRLAILGTRGIPARYGGFETFAEELALRLVARGTEVTVYCEANGTDQPGEYRGIRLVHIPATACGPLTTVLFDLRCLWHARNSYDVVYMLGYGAAPFCLIPQLWGTDVWLNVDGIEWARGKWNGAAKLYFKTMEWLSTWVPDRIIADADGIRAHLESRHRLSSPCSVIPYGAPVADTPPDASLLRKWNLEPGGYYLAVARIEPENHIREIIEGYRAHETNIPLVVAGNHMVTTDYARNLRTLAGPRVRLVGGVYDRDELRALRYHASAYFHGHSVGGTNPSLLEALGCGNLVIAHDNIFNREVVGDIGFYFSSSTAIPALLKAVESLSPVETAALASKAQTRIREAYDWSAIAERYLDLLQIHCGQIKVNALLPGTIPAEKKAGISAGLGRRNLT
ncbi:DUF1972 domain-containing protein [Geobacter hydrogenophilus]|uniref:Glycosyl transferase n=1 Tax=Geobacter hydrogenophilus TaxID=40983 RepID=A0A9W6LDW7_9BACT|nr:DUF1972 domain-containing protein [Geobacter hydrogenophilus]MBT0894455.1 DUF1972 domain-containing protein [Geobacter hydrogenophilus]GLI39390.1 glycosyl transferase [Geobacter hydrogenophilus]